MKRVLFAVVALVSACSFGASYEEWFTPKSGWAVQTVPVNIKVSNLDYIEDFPVDANIGEISEALNVWIEKQEIHESAKNAFKLSVAALANSIFAACQAQMNKVKIDNLGAALEGVFVNTYGQYQDASGNVISKTHSGIDTSALRQQLIANKNAVVAGGQASGGSESNPLKLIITQKPYDELQFEQHTSDGKSLTSLKGWYDLQDNAQSETLGGADYFAFGTRDYYFPITWGKSTELEWARWNGWDASCLSAGDDGGTGSQNNKPLHLRYWNGGDGGCGENLQNLLTNKNASIAADRRKHYILTRYGENDAGTHELHWLSFDDEAMEVGSEPNVDDHSIVMAQDEDASQDDPKKLRLKGFDAAKAARTENDKVPTIPNIQPTGDDLAWTSFKDFFADSVFKTSYTTGKVLLNGTKEGDKKLQVLALSYGDTDEDQTLSSFNGDGVSVDFGVDMQGLPQAPLAQMHNWDNPERSGAKTQYDIADILTNVNHSTDGWYFPLRNAQGVLQYADAKKITGIPSASVDGKTIESTRDKDAPDTAPEKLRIVGSKDAEEGQYLKMGSGGTVEWADAVVSIEPDAEGSYETYPIYTNEVDGVIRIGLNGWETPDSEDSIYGKIGGVAKSYRLTDSRTLEPDYDHETIDVAGYSGADNFSVAYKDNDNLESGLSWVAKSSGSVGVLIAKSGQAPTFDGVTACSDSLNRMLSDPADGDNRNKHKFLAKYNDTDVHWVGIDDVIAGGGGAPVDDASITTNTAHGALNSGLASLYDFANATAGTSPYVKVTNGVKTLAWGSARGAFELDVTRTQSGYSFTIGKCNYIYNRHGFAVAGTPTITTSTYVYLRIPHVNYSSASIVSDGSSHETDDETTYILLYYVNATTGAISDYRGAPSVQLWE